jgi:hypothetical protein
MCTPPFIKVSEMKMRSLYQSLKTISKHSFSILIVVMASPVEVRRKCHYENGKRPHGVLEKSMLPCQYITKNR